VNINLTGTAPFNLTYTNGITNSSLSGYSSSAYAFNASDTGTYSVIAISDAYCNGAATGSADVDNYPPLQVTLSAASSVCPGAPAVLTANASGGDNAPYTYTWSAPGSGSSITVSPSTETSYFVTADDACTGTVSDTITISMLPAPVVAFSSNVTSGCAPLCINLTESSTMPGGTITSWAWSMGTGSSTVQNPSHCYDAAGLYSIGLTVTGNNGCTSTYTNNNMITVNALPEANFTIPEVISIIQPSVQFNNTSLNAVTWSWDFGDVNDPLNNTSTQENPSHTYSQPGVYCAMLYVKNAAGCMDTVEYCVTVEPEFTFYIPGAFSPNGDGLNDYFSGKGENITEYEMSIYDRWGNLLFYSDDLNKQWDGMVKGGKEALLMDVYVYNINIKEGKFGQHHNYIGTVTIVK
jgi:gliding motility-associated-like protein